MRQSKGNIGNRDKPEKKLATKKTSVREAGNLAETTVDRGFGELQTHTPGPSDPQIPRTGPGQSGCAGLPTIVPGGKLRA